MPSVLTQCLGLLRVLEPSRLAFVKKQQSRMRLGAEAIRAPAIAEASTGIILSRDPAVEGQQPASMRRHDLRVDTAV